MFKAKFGGMQTLLSIALVSNLLVSQICSAKTIVDDLGQGLYEYNGIYTLKELPFEKCGGCSRPAGINGPCKAYLVNIGLMSTFYNESNNTHCDLKAGESECQMCTAKPEFLNQYKVRVISRPKNLAALGDVVFEVLFQITSQSISFIAYMDIVNNSSFQSEFDFVNKLF